MSGREFGGDDGASEVDVDVAVDVAVAVAVGAAFGSADEPLLADEPDEPSASLMRDCARAP
jgi:hypothetical protein